jgi:hypothetical protein
MKCLLTLIFVSAFFYPSTSQVRHPGFHFVDQIDEKRIDILFNDTLLTSYDYRDSIMKPVLFPINTRSGITVTRGFPLAPREGERVDHPHHIGLWLNYESVNGLDFWNNSTAIPYGKRNHYGTIIHDGVVKTEPGNKRAVLEVTARWVDHRGNILLRETTAYKFSVSGSDFIIDRKTTLNTMEVDVEMKDVKDGLLGVRVSRELEHPATEPEIFVDNKGNATAVPVINNDGVSGEYLSSEGIKGNDVWATRARWVSLRGKMDDEPISITIIDHPANPGYPTYWHARGYGLFAANPLGQDIFSKGKEKLNFKINKGEAASFQYRIVVHEGTELSSEEIEALALNFTKP